NKLHALLSVGRPDRRPRTPWAARPPACPPRAQNAHPLGPAPAATKKTTPRRFIDEFPSRKTPPVDPSTLRRRLGTGAGRIRPIMVNSPASSTSSRSQAAAQTTRRDDLWHS